MSHIGIEKASPEQQTCSEGDICEKEIWSLSRFNQSKYRETSSGGFDGNQIAALFTNEAP